MAGKTNERAPPLLLHLFLQDHRDRWCGYEGRVFYKPVCPMLVSCVLENSLELRDGCFVLGDDWMIRDVTQLVAFIAEPVLKFLEVRQFFGPPASDMWAGFGLGYLLFEN